MWYTSGYRDMCHCVGNNRSGLVFPTATHLIAERGILMKETWKVHLISYDEQQEQLEEMERLTIREYS